MKNWTASLKAIQDNAHAAAVDLASKYEREVLRPFCDRTGVRFVSGNGTWFFRLRGPAPRGLATIEKTLRCVVLGHEFGTYCGDVTPTVKP